MQGPRSIRHKALIHICVLTLTLRPYLTVTALSSGSLVLCVQWLSSTLGLEEWFMLPPMIYLAVPINQDAPPSSH